MMNCYYILSSCHSVEPIAGIKKRPLSGPFLPYLSASYGNTVHHIADGVV
jgi:hypothetical protein